MKTPFRWNIDKESELGRIINDTQKPIDETFLTELIHSSAKILAFSDNAMLYFVGRSPENYYDFLNGIYSENNSIKERFSLFQFSARFYSLKEIEYNSSFELIELKKYMKSIGLSPSGILNRKVNTALVDLVYSGSTMINIISILKYWAILEKCDWKSVKSKIKIVGITRQMKNSPNTERWQQHPKNKALLDGIKVKNVSVDWDFWEELGEQQAKTTQSFSPQKWVDIHSTKPKLDESKIKAINFAFTLNQLAKDKEVISNLRLAMQNRQEMKYRWFKEFYKNVGI